MLVQPSAGVESKNSPLRHAYPVVRNDAQHEGASRVARPVNDNGLARLVNGLEQPNKFVRVAPRARQNPYGTECRQKSDQKQNRSDSCA
jgi:hypothetical protein